MKIKVRPAFVLYLFIIWLIDGFGTSISLLCALAIHEAAHLAVGLCCHEAYEQIEITPLGGIITYKADRTSCKGVKGVLIAAAGPISNYAAAILLVSGSAFSRLPRDIMEPLIMINLAMMLINLLPVLPLDGGRILFSVGYYLFPLAGLITLLTALGVFAGAVCVILSFYSAAVWGKLNVSLLAAGIYIMICSKKHGEILYGSNLYTAIQERMNTSRDVSDIRLIEVCGNANLLDVLPKLYRSERCVCVMKMGDDQQFIAENQLLQALLMNPGATFAEAFKEDNRGQEKRNP